MLSSTACTSVFVFGVWSRLCICKPPTAANIEDNTIEDEIYNIRSEYAAQMLSYMNLSVSPCDDFYAYACGNWKNTIKEKSTTKQRVNFLDIDFHITETVEKMLQRSNILDIAPEYEAEFQMAKKFYENCLNSQLVPFQKSHDYLDILQSIGGFPAVDSDWTASDFSWFNMSAHLTNYGVVGLINENIMDSYPFLPYFLLPEFGFEISLHNDTISNKSSNAYQDNRLRMQTILSIYGLEKNKSEEVIDGVFKFLEAVLDMTSEFNEDQKECESQSEHLDILVLREQFKAHFDIAWMGKFQEVPDGFMPCLYFYQELSVICEDHKEAVANYLSLKFLFHMDSRLENPQFQKDYCTYDIRQNFFVLFDHLYMKLYFNREAVSDVKSIFKEIRNTLRELIEKADWLDDATRQAALLKESALHISVGRYEDIKTEKMLMSQLKNLKFVKENYEANNLILKKFKVNLDRFYGLHQEEFDNGTKPMSCQKSMVANAYFYISDNTMYIPAGVMQPPVYDKNWPSTLKWATLGFLVGHEVGHGFDNFGRTFDHEGNMNNWWSKDALKMFEDRIECYTDHFGNYTIEEINRNVDGPLTNAENVADATGLLMAFTSYKRQMEKKKQYFESSIDLEKQEQMPGLDLTSDQLFFLASAQLLCSDYKEAHYWKQLNEGHTIEKYRVHGMLSNDRNFAQAYECFVGDEMHPSLDKCHLW